MQAAKKDAGSQFDKAKDAAGNAYDSAKQGAEHAASGVAGAAGQAANAARDAAGNLVGAAKDAASNLGSTAKDAAGQAGKKAEEWTAAAGSRVESLADTVRQQGPRDGMLGQGTEYVATGLEKAGEYLQDKNLSGMMGDMTELIKRNPIPALLVGLGVGYLLGKSLRS